jgi:ATP-dependent RNA helicase DeaD
MLKNLGLKQNIMSALKKLKYQSFFEVQEKVIPLILKGKNVVFTSRTGSGKTLAYSLGYLGKINPKLGLQMLIIVPTRELAIQVTKELEQIGSQMDLNVGTIYGGREISGDYRTTKRKNQIIVATPGRLIQHINTKEVKVGEVKLLVFDESDQMFDNGFTKECHYIATRVSKDAQIALASATMSDKVKTFVDDVIFDYELLEIGYQIPQNIVQERYDVEIVDKNLFLLDFLKEEKAKKILIFCNKKLRSEEIADLLELHGYNAKWLNNNLTQEERINRLNNFKNNQLRILVASDIAARGLDIKNVDLVINYDVPPRKEYYVHRIGRSGRKDKKGRAVTFVCSEDQERFNNIITEFDLKF